MQQLWFIIKNYLYMFQASICPSSGVQVVCYSIWCLALGIVAVVPRSRCMVLCPKHVEIIFNNKSQLLHQVGTSSFSYMMHGRTYIKQIILQFPYFPFPWQWQDFINMCTYSMHELLSLLSGLCLKSSQVQNWGHRSKQTSFFKRNQPYLIQYV
jgi:hypothetical protein